MGIPLFSYFESGSLQRRCGKYFHGRPIQSGKFSGSAVLQWATFFGGNGEEDMLESDNLAIDSCGNVFVGFNTSSSNLPVQFPCDGGYYHPSLNTTQSNFLSDNFVARFSNQGNL